MGWHDGLLSTTFRYVREGSNSWYRFLYWLPDCLSPIRSMDYTMNEKVLDNEPEDDPVDYTAYQVVQGDDLTDLTQKVNRQIHKGYIPLGGAERNGQRIMQAMVKTNG